MGFFRDFMRGRYGMDRFNLFLFICSIILIIILRVIYVFTGHYWITLFAYLPAAFALFRMLSRSVQKRRIENEKYLAARSKITGFFAGIRDWVANRKVYKYFRCPKCHSKLRVPRMGGKTLEVTCRNCGNKFKIKS